MNSLAVIVLILTSRYGTDTVLGNFGEGPGRTGAPAACMPDTSTRYLPFGEFSSARASGDGSALDALLSVPPWLGDFVDWIPIPDGARFRVRVAPTSFLLGCTLKMSL